MDFSRSDIQTMLLDSAERLLAEDSGAEYWREQRHNTLGFDVERWARFAELGWLALPLPESAGGLAGSIEDVALLNVALGRALAPEPYVSCVVLAGDILGRAAPDGPAQQALEAIAIGTERFALAHQETGIDPLAGEAPGTVARRTGDGFVLDGAKLLCFDAPSAHQLIVSARIEGEDGLALFLVSVSAEGLSLAPYPLIDGTRAADVAFRAVALGHDALLAGSNGGAAVLAAAIDRAQIALMAQAVGAMEAANAVCGAYGKERKQFGVAIGSFQAIQHMLADMFVAANQARSMLYHALANADAPAEKRQAAISAARIVIGEASQLVSRNGIQLHGGYGLTDEYAISHYFRRLMCIEKQFGDLNGHTARFGATIFA